MELNQRAWNCHQEAGIGQVRFGKYAWTEHDRIQWNSLKSSTKEIIAKRGKAVIITSNCNIISETCVHVWSLGKPLIVAPPPIDAIRKLISLDSVVGSDWSIVDEYYHVSSLEYKTSHLGSPENKCSPSYFWTEFHIVYHFQIKEFISDITVTILHMYLLVRKIVSRYLRIHK